MADTCGEWGDEWGEFEWGAAKSWGARENGDPADTTSLLLPIEPGCLDAMQTAADRIWKQYEGRETWADIMEIVGEPFAELDVVLGRVDVERYRSTAVGVQLDEIGAVVNRPRGGLLDDELYRLAILVDTASLYASGTIPEILELAHALVGDGHVITLDELFPANFRLRITDLETPIFLLLADILSDVPAAGVGSLLSTFAEATVGGWGSVHAYRPAELVAREYDPEMLTMFDPISGGQGVPDGSTYVPAFEARNYNGTTDHVDWPSVEDLSTEVPLTISAWIRPSTVAAGLANFFNVSNTVPQQSVIFRRSGAGLQFTRAYSTTGVLRTSSDVLVADTWSHVAAVYKGTGLGADITLFHNGEEVASYVTTTNSSGTVRSADGLWSIGGRVDADAQMFAGDVAQVQVWVDRELPATTIRRLWLRGVTGGSFDGPPADVSIDDPASWDSVTGAIADAVAHWAHAREIGA